MERKDFLKMIAMSGLAAFNKFTDNLSENGTLMPVLFIGHGSPMNGIEHNSFTQHWVKMAETIPTPAAVLVVSAHWLSNGTKITAMDFPETIHDFGGFPAELFAVQYPAPGSPAIAKETASLIHSTKVELAHDWGLDHGTWTIIRHMYPKANIPVLQLSIDYAKGPEYHYNLAKELYQLRKKGILFIGSGNMVHNLRMIAWDKMDQPEYGYDWALDINSKFKHLISSGDHAALVKYENISKDIKLAIPTPDHYLPLMYTLGLKGTKDEVKFFNDKAVAGSLTMTSVRFG